MSEIVSKLPKEIGKHIMDFVISDPNSVEFHMDLNFTNKHQVAFRHGQLLINSKNSHICVVKRGRRKPRYYLSKRIIEENSCDDCWGYGEVCGSSYCCGGTIYSDPYFKSKYLGYSLDKALLEFFLEPSNQKK